MSSENNHLSDSYFVAVDGLRAIAVMSVVLYHLNGFIPAGFVGVDVFFVISGFVVANAAVSLPLTSLKNFMAAFYARRLLRIVPALIICLLFSFCVATMIIPGGWLSETNTKTGLAAFFGFSNIVIALTTGDYWSPRAEFNPFTHTWSLGVEEQFYLLAPFLLFGWLKGFRKSASFVLAVFALASLVAASLTSTSASRVLAFYSLHARFWELSIGVALAFGINKWRPLLVAAPKLAQEFISIVALIGLIISLLAADSTAFPWPWALLPVFCTALLIVSVVASTDTVICRVLSLKAILWTGKRSYSLYLWHWPIFVFARWSVGLDGFVEQAVALVLSFAFAAASYRYVEQPVRFSQLAKKLTRVKVVALGVLALLFSVGAAAGVNASRSWLSLSVTRNMGVWDATTDLPAGQAPCAITTTGSSFSGGGMQTFKASGCPTGKRTVYVAGDSHASAYTAMLKMFVRETGHTVVLFSGPGCSVFRLDEPMRLGRAQCVQFTGGMLKQVEALAQPGDVLFLPGLRVQRLRDQWGGVNPKPPLQPSAREDAIAEASMMLRPVAQKNIRIVFEEPKPIFKAPPFRCSDWFNRRNPICEGGMEMAKSDLEKIRAPAVSSIKTVIASLPGATTWDPFPLLCPDVTCASFRNGKPLFFDGDHLSGYGNSELLKGFTGKIEAL